MYYNREIESKILKLSSQYPAIILTGARQTGKTTLLRQLFPKYNYITLDLPSLAEQAETDPEGFLLSNPSPVIIDEAQYAPALFRHLKTVIDQNRDLVGQFIITVSQKFSLMREVSDSLAGRCVWLELEGLDLTELSQGNLDPKDLKQLYQVLIRGSLPELWRKPDLSVVDYYRSYLATYLERDVRQIVNVGNLRNFERFIRVCASRNAQLLNKSELAKDVGVTLNTINQWLSILEACNQIVLLEPYFANTGKRIVKSPKLFFCEIGLLCFLLGINDSNIQNSPFIGNIWESFILSEFRKWIKNCKPDAVTWFYRDNRGREVDFIIESDGQLNFYEVKWTAKPEKSDIKNLNSVYDDISLKNRTRLITPGNKYLLSRTPNKYLLDNTVNVTNLEYFLRPLEPKK